MKLKSLASAALLSLSLVSASAQALMVTPPVASATFDWASFEYQVLSIGGPLDGGHQLTWLNQSTDVSADNFEFVSDGSADWESLLNVVVGVAAAGASNSGLSAEFTQIPTSLNAYAQSNRYGSFTISAKSLVTFSVNASVSIDMSMPLNGNAYAWAVLDVDGPGFGGDENSPQHSGTQKLTFAQGLGMPQAQSGKLLASFINTTNEDMSGTLRAFATVSSYGFIAVVPEPESYALMLAGLGLMAFVARRRKTQL